jgi:superfamily II DNA or RNA helicase
MEAKGDVITIPRGCWGDLLPFLQTAEVVDKRTLHTPKPVPTTIEERFYQETAIQELLEWEEGFLKAPAGSGKTVMGLELAARVGQPTLWLTHLDRLFKQVIERIEMFIPLAAERGIGEIREGSVIISDFLTIGMVPSIVRMDITPWQDFFGMVLVDEAHHVPAATFLDVIRRFNAYHIYGLTATDYRNDGLDPVMFNIMGPVRAEIEYDTLATAGQIMRPVIHLVETEWYSNFDNVHQNLYQKLLKRIVKDKQRNKLITHHVVAEAKQEKICIVISGRRVHCRELYDAIRQEWGQTALAIGDVKKSDVDAAIKAMETGDITVLVTTFEMLGEGFDLSKLDRLFFTVPFKAASRVEQGIGRLQRPAPKKVDAVVYEFVDARVSYCKYLFKQRMAVYEKLGVGVVTV